jgi:hypothetical protein
LLAGSACSGHELGGAVARPRAERRPGEHQRQAAGGQPDPEPHSDPHGGCASVMAAECSPRNRRTWVEVEVNGVNLYVAVSRLITTRQQIDSLVVWSCLGGQRPGKAFEPHRRAALAR